MNQELKTNITSTNPRFSVSGLNPGYQYVASIFAFNSKGKSEAVVHQISMLRQPEKQLTAEKGTTLFFCIFFKKHLFVNSNDQPHRDLHKNIILYFD